MPLISAKQKPITDQQRIKESNLKFIFDAILRSEAVSRSELAQRSGLSPTTVYSLVDEMIDGGVVSEIGAEAGAEETAKVGRRPQLLRINSEGAFIACAWLSRAHIQCQLFDLKCNVVHTRRKRLSQPVDYNAEIQSGLDEMRGLVAPGRLLGLCVALPAVIGRKNRQLNSTVLHVEGDKSMLSYLEAIPLDMPVVLGNESIFYTYAEKAAYSPSDIRNMLYVNIGAGVGAGIFLNGEIYMGSTGLAGEIGHMTLDMNGRPCECGGRGCLERYVCVPAILESYAQEKKICASDIAFEDFVAALSNGEPAAEAVAAEAARCLAAGIESAINLLDIDTVVLGGEISLMGEPFLQQIGKNMFATINKAASRCRVCYARLDRGACLLGMAKYFLDNVFQLSLEYAQKLYII